MRKDASVGSCPNPKAEHCVLFDCWRVNGLMVHVSDFWVNQWKLRAASANYSISCSARP